ncbi:hypothetical protein [Vibrio sp. WXL103]|uniref:hypothetical protein n=1 Tax=unclassified Vibrio TaxID=2614977 RepID=UPI003EC7631F
MSYRKRPSAMAIWRDFLLGSAMMGSGFYLLLDKISVGSTFRFNTPIYRYAGYGAQNIGSFGLTSGMVFVPMIIGIIWIFMNHRSMFAWMLTLCTCGAMIFGVITNLKIRMLPMSSFDFILILVLAFGGVGIFLRFMVTSSRYRNA